VSGEITAVNPALKSQPGLLNSDPYGEGWFIKLKPSDWAAENGALVTGADGIAAYTAFLQSQGIDCGA
jgi:glycine cleavage system H protein